MKLKVEDVAVFEVEARTAGLEARARAVHTACMESNARLARVLAASTPQTSNHSSKSSHGQHVPREDHGASSRSSRPRGSVGS